MNDFAITLEEKRAFVGILGEQRFERMIYDIWGLPRLIQNARFEGLLAEYGVDNNVKRICPNYLQIICDTLEGLMMGEGIHL